MGDRNDGFVSEMRFGRRRISCSSGWLGSLNSPAQGIEPCEIVRGFIQRLQPFHLHTICIDTSLDVSERLVPEGLKGMRGGGAVNGPFRLSMRGKGGASGRSCGW